MLLSLKSPTRWQFMFQLHIFFSCCIILRNFCVFYSFSLPDGVHDVKDSRALFFQPLLRTTRKWTAIRTPVPSSPHTLSAEVTLLGPRPLAQHAQHAQPSRLLSGLRGVFMKCLLRSQQHGEQPWPAQPPAHEAFPWDGQPLLTSLPEPSVTVQFVIKWLSIIFYRSKPRERSSVVNVMMAWLWSTQIRFWVRYVDLNASAV